MKTYKVHDLAEVAEIAYKLGLAQEFVEMSEEQVSAIQKEIPVEVTRKGDWFLEVAYYNGAPVGAYAGIDGKGGRFVGVEQIDAIKNQLA